MSVIRQARACPEDLPRGGIRPGIAALPEEPVIEIRPAQADPRDKPEDDGKGGALSPALHGKAGAGACFARFPGGGIRYRLIRADVFSIQQRAGEVAEWSKALPC